MSVSGFCFYVPGVGSFKFCFVFLPNFLSFCVDYDFIFYFVFFLLISLQEIVPLEEVFQTLMCDSNGLTIASAERYSVSLIMF